jgi:hypothetical protein
MEMASFFIKIRHFFGDTSLTERSIGAGPPVIIQLSGYDHEWSREMTIAARKITDTQTLGKYVEWHIFIVSNLWLGGRADIYLHTPHWVY